MQRARERCFVPCTPPVVFANVAVTTALCRHRRRLITCHYHEATEICRFTNLKTRLQIDFLHSDASSTPTLVSLLRIITSSTYYSTFPNGKIELVCLLVDLVGVKFGLKLIPRLVATFPQTAFNSGGWLVGWLLSTTLSGISRSRMVIRFARCAAKPTSTCEFSAIVVAHWFSAKCRQQTAHEHSQVTATRIVQTWADFRVCSRKFEFRQ